MASTIIRPPLDGQAEALRARTDRAGRFEHLADVGRPGGILAFGNLEADLDVIAGILAFGLEALDELAQFPLVPLDALRHVGDNFHLAIGESRGPEILLRLKSRNSGALAILEEEGTLEPGDDGLGLAQCILRVMLQAGELGGRQRCDVVAGEAQQVRGCEMIGDHDRPSRKRGSGRGAPWVSRALQPFPDGGLAVEDQPAIGDAFGADALDMPAAQCPERDPELFRKHGGREIPLQAGCSRRNDRDFAVYWTCKSPRLSVRDHPRPWKHKGRRLGEAETGGNRRKDNSA